MDIKENELNIILDALQVAACDLRERAKDLQKYDFNISKLENALYDDFNQRAKAMDKVYTELCTIY